ncbi:MAG TPA: sulfatase-like hydrolase/transferase [Gammaproteobacteria bacterium]|nr:sulfatase-like hydrolase/transferase [Gammaproteobacteria bacterium]
MTDSLNRRDFIGAAAGAAAATVAVPRAVRAQQRPNVLFILADDLGYGDLSCYGRPDYDTPVLDRLATQGMKFMSAYAAAPVCTPTRCAFMTGRYPQRFEVGLQEPLTVRSPPVGLPQAQPTIATRMRAAGYETALIGKWHLGWRPEYQPNRFGFDEFFGSLSGALDYFTHVAPDADIGTEPDLWENDRRTTTDGYLTDVFTDRAIDYVTRRRSKPFYLSLHYTAPHSPWEGPDDRAEVDHDDHGPGPMTNGGSLGVYAEMMRSMDAGIGRVLAALRDARLERNTLVIFTSDNGGERYSFNWPFSSEKFSLYEGGIRVPAIVRWPGVVPAGAATQQAAITMDWTATILAAAGAPADAAPLDGDSLLPVLTGEREVYDRVLFWRTRERAAARIGRWKYVQEGADDHLYDIGVDLGEKTDLKTREPAAFEDVKGRYTAWAAQMLPRPT